MTKEDDQTLADIRRWYHDNGMPFEEEDWGPRSETGESSGPQVQDREREGRDGIRSSASTPDRMWWWEKQRFPWRERTQGEKEWLYLLDAFFAPYIAMLPRPKGNLVRQVFGEQMTYREVAEEAGLFDRSGARKRVLAAVRDLTRLIANDDALFSPPPDGRERDHEAEARAARRVFMIYVATQRTELAPEEEQP